MKARLLTPVRLLSSCLILSLVLAGGALLRAQAVPQTAPATTANPELVGELAKELGSTPQQAEGAAGAMFGHAKSKMNASDWSKVSGAVPGMDGLLKAAPAAATTTGTTGTAGTGLAAVSGAAGMAGMADVASSFTKLGLKPEMVAKAVPVLTNYVSKSGGAGVGQLLAGALK